MNRVEIEAKVSEELGMTQVEVAKVMNAILSTVSESLENGEDVRIVRFGSFKVSDRAPRVGKSPVDGSPMQIPAGRRVSFKPGKELKERVNRK